MTDNLPKIGCVQHDCQECKDRERQSVPAGWYVTKTDESTVKHWPITDKQALSLSLAANGDDMVVNGELKYCFRLGELKHLIALAAAPQPQPLRKSYPMTHPEAAAAIAINSALHRLRDNNPEGAAEVLEHAKKVLAAAPQPQPVQQLELTEYDAGLLNDFGGGNVEWWQDYIRAELGRAFEHYQSQVQTQGEKQ